MSAMGGKRTFWRLRLGVPLLALATVLLAQPMTTSATKSIFTPSETVALSEEARSQCGIATPREVMGLSPDKREKALNCLVSATVKRSGTILPKLFAPGATIVSVKEDEGFPIFVLQLDPDHPRALAPADQPSDYDQLISNRTCDDSWLGGLIDAGMVNGAQGGTMIIYKLQQRNGETIALLAIGQCFDPK